MRTLKELGNLTGRTAVIAGGAGHIGLASAEALIELGARVCILDYRASRERAEQLNRLRPDAATGIPCDLSDEQQIRSALRNTVWDFGSLDILLHCAAYTGDTRRAGWSSPFPEQTTEALAAAFSINVTSAFVMAQEMHALMPVSKSGTIVLLGSIYGLLGPDMSLYENTHMANPVGYGISKGGLIQLMRYLSTLLAPRIRVNMISPGGVQRQQPETFQDRYCNRTPLRRMAIEEDVKGAVAYLASDLSSYVTGHNLIIDGGWTAW